MTHESIQIENNIPIPPKNGRQKWKFIEDLQINQSFVIPDKDRPSVLRVARQLGFDMTTRRLPIQEGFDRRVRIWRIA